MGLWRSFFLFFLLLLSGNTFAVGEVVPIFFNIWFTLPVDAFNIISVPILPLWNPWKEYQNENIEKKDRVEEWVLNYSSIILEPTDELKKSCNKKGYFISNFGCTKCSYNDKSGVVASDEELKRCFNRFKGVNVISYFCDDVEPVHANSNECVKCQNRRMMNDLCMKKCTADKPLQDIKSGKRYSCDEDDWIETTKEDTESL